MFVTRIQQQNVREKHVAYLRSARIRRIKAEGPLDSETISVPYTDLTQFNPIDSISLVRINLLGAPRHDQCLPPPFSNTIQGS